jgi:secretion/DNA translocation related TadE-like protein
MSRGVRLRRHESGSGTVWVLAIALVVVVGGVVAATVASVAGAGRRADTAADLAALSAAARLATTPESACHIARRVVVAHRAHMVACTAHGEQVEVAVEVEVRGLTAGLFVVRSRARADTGGYARAPPRRTPCTRRVGPAIVVVMSPRRGPIRAAVGLHPGAGGSPLSGRRIGRDSRRRTDCRAESAIVP